MVTFAGSAQRCCRISLTLTVYPIILEPSRWGSREAYVISSPAQRNRPPPSLGYLCSHRAVRQWWPRPFRFRVSHTGNVLLPMLEKAAPCPARVQRGLGAAGELWVFPILSPCGSSVLPESDYPNLGSWVAFHSENLEAIGLLMGARWANFKGLNLMR